LRLSVRGRLLVLPVLLMLATVSLIAFIEYNGQRSWLLQREFDDHQRMALEAVRTVRYQGSWQAVADTVEHRFRLRTTILAADGRVLADSRVVASRMDNHARRPEVIEALAGNTGFAVRNSTTQGVELVYCAVPYRYGEAAVLRLSESLESANRFSTSIARLTVAASAVALLVGALVLLLIGGGFTRRLQELQGVALRIGRGEAGARTPDSTQDDLGQLGQALNRMREELDARLEALRRERDDREQILAHMADGVALVDGADRVVHVNHAFAELLAVPRRPDPGTLFAGFTRQPEFDDMLCEARAGGRTVERVLRPWSTGARALRASATPLGPAPAQPVLLVLHDLSEAEALQRMREDLVANVSHELRTPLTSLRGYAETLLDGGLDDAEHREQFVRTIRDGAVRLQELVEDLLSLAELERSDAALRREPCDLRELAAEQVERSRPVAEAAGLSLVLEPGAPVPAVADRVRLEQVLANLVDNAIKYTDRGAVTVSVGLDGDIVWGEVRDTGIGIPAHDLPRVFERFYRVDKARSREHGGTGLGLAIVKHAVALHGGEVSVRSRAGEGSTFRFELPATPRA
jgi:two-component system phosphate regulon sensor histidine kinase PhoR